MNVNYWVTRPEYKEGVLDFITFLLRFYTNLDYDSFSDKTDIVNPLKRSEMLKCWNDLKNLANGVSIFQKRCDDKYVLNIYNLNVLDWQLILGIFQHSQIRLTQTPKILIPSISESTN